MVAAPFMIHEDMDGPHNFALYLKTKGPNNPDIGVNIISDWGPQQQSEINMAILGVEPTMHGS